MISLVQRLATLAVLSAALAWGLALTEAGHPWWAGLGVAVFLAGHTVVLGIEFWCLRHVTRANGQAVGAPSMAQLFSAWVHEAAIAPRVFCWRQPFRAYAEPDFLQGAHGKTGVLLVHGLVCNRAFWNPWMREFRRHGVPYLAINLEPIFASIDRYTPQIEPAVSAVVSATGRPCVVVAHSMGGLVVRKCLAASNRSIGIHHVVTVGTPHGGTWLARFGRSASGVEMRLGSVWLSGLEADEKRRLVEAGATTGYTCFYSDCDNIVFPVETATLPGADNRLIAGAAHVQLAFKPEVLREVLRIVAEADEQPNEPAGNGSGETLLKADAAVCANPAGASALRTRNNN